MSETEKNIQKQMFKMTGTTTTKTRTKKIKMNVTERKVRFKMMN